MKQQIGRLMMLAIMVWHIAPVHAEVPATAEASPEILAKYASYIADCKAKKAANDMKTNIKLSGLSCEAYYEKYGKKDD